MENVGRKSHGERRYWAVAEDGGPYFPPPHHFP
eukprot:CAMPEP_0206576138 /NCGR_PEP_ID=MMETSP0325_2-20121206/30559_1 /ASSEMBLY_ACC=CAM_ASM_000347 /TAXON_ID=2866 /ORGANISM="Crypthecodinium cohnii, Strain Seligo" /LENGTH=32 /DNA_ID= /DNA_START= /DNA_END= /DNA_ORIENTATION=